MKVILNSTGQSFKNQFIKNTKVKKEPKSP